MTNKLDLVKIFVLGVLILAPTMGLMVGGYLIFKENYRYLSAFGLGILGYLISILIHQYWNRRPGVMGIPTSL